MQTSSQNDSGCREFNLSIPHSADFHPPPSDSSSSIQTDSVAETETVAVPVTVVSVPIKGARAATNASTKLI